MESDPIRPWEAIRAWRIVLIAAGIALLGVGGFALLTGVAPSHYPGVAIWLAGAIVLHDGVGAMAVFAATVLVRRAGGVIPFAVLAIVQGTAVLVVIVALLVTPEIVKQAIGSANPTILPLDYARNLVVFTAGVGVVAVVAIVAAVALGRRPSTRVRRTADRRS